ncbi:hypothetical protein MPER_05291, partial [Moniliophthora perniciosa FA553]
YIALAKGAQQAKWVHQFLSEIGREPPKPSQLRGDNRGSIILSENPTFFARVKHIDIKHHYLRDEVEKGNVKVVFVGSEENPADILTKPLTRELHRCQVARLGLIMDDDQA